MLLQVALGPDRCARVRARARVRAMARVRARVRALFAIIRSSAMRASVKGFSKLDMASNTRG